jgi:hypothetical protein
MNDKYVDFSSQPMTSTRRLAKDIAIAWETFSKEQLEACQAWLKEAIENESDNIPPIQSEKRQAYVNCLQRAENIMVEMLKHIGSIRDDVAYGCLYASFQCWQEEKDGL